MQARRSHWRCCPLIRSSSRPASPSLGPSGHFPSDDAPTSAVAVQTYIAQLKATIEDLEAARPADDDDGDAHAHFHGHERCTADHGHADHDHAEEKHEESHEHAVSRWLK